MRGWREGGVKKKTEGSKWPKRMDVSLRAGCWERMQDGGKRRQGHEKEAERDGERKKDRKRRSPLSSNGRLTGFHTIESDTSTQHSSNTLALILILAFLVGGWWNLHLDWNDLGMVGRPQKARGRGEARGVWGWQCVVHRGLPCSWKKKNIYTRKHTPNIPTRL